MTYFSCSKNIVTNSKKFGTDLRLTWRHHLNFLALKITCVKNEKLSLSRRHDLFWNFVFVLHCNSWHCTVVWQSSGSHQARHRRYHIFKFDTETETLEAFISILRLRLRLGNQNFRYRYWDWDLKVTIFDTETETDTRKSHDTETDTETFTT